MVWSVTINVFLFLILHSIFYIHNNIISSFGNNFFRKRTFLDAISKVKKRIKRKKVRKILYSLLLSGV